MRRAEYDRRGGGRLRYKLAVAAVVIAGTGVVGAVALASIPDAGGVIHGCFDDVRGTRGCRTRPVAWIGPCRSVPPCSTT